MSGSPSRESGEMTGSPPVGWFNGRPSQNTRKLLVEAGCFLYDRDALNDELPYWVEVEGRNHLVIPYSLETNDNRFDRNTGFGSADDFARYMIDTLRSHVRGGGRGAEADEHWPPRPPDRAAGQGGRPDQVSRTRPPA